MILPKNWNAIEGQKNVSFFKTWPHGFEDFYMKSNGGNGLVGESYVDFLPMEKIDEENTLMSVNEFAPGFKIFAFDGGNEAYAVDFRSSPFRIVRLPLIGMASDQAIEMANDLPSFFEVLRKQV